LDSLTDAISFLASTAVFSAITSAVMGGILTVYRQFIIGEEDLRRRIDLQKQRLIEKMTVSYKNILGDAFVLVPAPKEPDPIVQHVKELFRVTSVLNRLERLRSTATCCYGWLFVTVGIGVIGFLLSWTNDLVKACVAIVCGMAIVTQLVLFYELRAIAARFRECEDMT